MTARLRGERGGILVLSAVAIPVFLLLTALVVDAGNWFTHKRQLQNKADAGALAAGVEYISQLNNCVSAPGPTGTAITDVAKNFAGTTEAIPGSKYNTTINEPTRLTIRVNATTATAADWSDGGSPCADHTTGDSISAGGMWTDVKARETNIGTLMGGFGLDLLSVEAQARVEVKQLKGIRHGGLPLVNETGDYVDCVWAEFVNTRTGATSGILAGGVSNPIALTADSTTPRHWTADVPAGIDITSNRDDIGVQYWMGAKTSGSCNFSTSLKGIVPDGPINWINVYDDDSPGADQAPLLHHFQVQPGSCGPSRVSFINSTASCTLTFTAEVDKGPGSNTYPTRILVDIENPTVQTQATSTPGSPTLQTVAVSAGGPNYTGTITIDPNEVSSSTTYSQDYTQVGAHRLRVRWEKTTGKVGSQNCTPGNPCTGTFLSEQPANWQHQFYVHDPLNSNPLFKAELLNTGAGTPIQNSWAAGGPDTTGFTIDVTNYGVDQTHIITVRESVQSSGNRTFTVNCGQGGGASSLRDAIRDGCPTPITINARNDSCSPAPPIADGSWDCVETIPGNKTSVRQGLEDRFTCSMTNHWIDGTSPANLSDTDPRYAYIFLTSFGRVFNVSPNTWLPVRAFLRIYVTGWDKHPNSYETCSGANDKPPRGYDSNGAQLWGHFVDVITLSDDAIPADAECDTSLSLLMCRPILVR